MKNYILTALLIISVAFSSFSKDFEGEINYSITYSDLPDEMKMYVAMLPQKFLVKIKNHLTKSGEATRG